MELRQSNRGSIALGKGRHAGGRMRIDSDDTLILPGLVPILDLDVLDDDEFEADGVNDFVRDYASRGDHDDL